MPLATIEVELFAKHHLGAFLELSHSEYGPSAAANIGHITWKHLGSPHGASTYVRLVANGKTVGRALLQPTSVLTESGRFSIASVTDILIDPKFRSPPSNFTSLMRASADVSAFSSVYHTSNRRTDPLYRKLFRFPKPLSLRGYGFPIRLANIVSRIAGPRLQALDWLMSPLRPLVALVANVGLTVTRLNVSERLPDDDTLSRLLLRSLRQSGPLLARSRAFLKWRFIDAPVFAATVYCIERGGKCLGYVATRTVGFDGLTVLVIVDFLLDPALTLLDRFTVRSWIIRRAMTLNVDALLTMANPRSRAALIAVGFPFLRIPDRYLPHETPIFLRSRGSENRFLETAESLHLTLTDLDYI